MKIKGFLMVVLTTLMAMVAAVSLAQDVVPDLQNEKLETILQWIQIFTSVVGSFALIAAATPTDRDDRIVGKLMKIVDFLGANFGAAKNKKDGR